MNVNIEKITNGFILTIDGVRTFCDVPEAICGHMAELVLETCKRLESPNTDGAKMKTYAGIAAAMGQIASSEKSVGLIPRWADMVRWASE